VAPKRSRHFLGEVLLERGLVRPEAVEAAVEPVLAVVVSGPLLGRNNAAALSHNQWACVHRVGRPTTVLRSGSEGAAPEKSGKSRFRAKARLIPRMKIQHIPPLPRNRIVPVSPPAKIKLKGHML